MITDKGMELLMGRFVNQGSFSEPSQFKVGRDNTTPVVTNTDLNDPVPLSGTEEVDDCTTADWTDSADMTTSVNSSIYKVASAALNTAKDGTGSATASTSKNTTSRDFTSKELSVWFYIVDSTALAKLAASSCLEIRFGSDSSNYYSWTFDNSDLATGWNLLTGLTSSTATTTGSPTITACDYSYLGLTATSAATVWAAGDMVMDDWKLISSGDYFLNFESGYPSVDNTNKEITYRMVLNSVQANGYNLQEIGIFNTDTTEAIWNHDIFTGVSKTDTEEVRFIIKDQFSAN